MNTSRGITWLAGLGRCLGAGIWLRSALGRDTSLQIRAIGRLAVALWLGIAGVAVSHAGTVTYVYTDPQGTPLAEADASGNITATFDYAPYGSQALGTPPSGPGYTGHVNDADTGLVYMQARYYDPVTGRFLSVDPVGPAPGNAFNFNRYGYANNNPVANLDPDGRCTGSHIGNGDGTCVSSGGFTTKTGNAHSQAGARNNSVRNNQLTYNVVSPVRTGANGAIDTSIAWKLKNASKKGGYIVQTMNISGSGDLRVKNGTYYEAWRVNAGSKKTALMDSGNFPYDDNFHFGGYPGHGTIRWNASARFYEDLHLPHSFERGNVPYAGILPSTYENPNLSTKYATPPVKRELSNSW